MKKFLLLVLFPLTSFSQVDLSVDSIFHRSNVGGHFENGLTYYSYGANESITTEYSAIVTNQGISNATGVTLHVQVKENSNILFSETSIPLDISAGATDSLIIPLAYTDVSADLLNICYWVTSDSVDLNSSNDSTQVSLDKTKLIYSRGTGVQSDTLTTGAISDSTMGVGIVYQFESGLELFGTHVYIDTMAQNVGSLLFSTLTKLDTISGEFVYVDQSADHQIVNSDLGSWVNLCFGSYHFPDSGEVFVAFVGDYGFNCVFGRSEQTIDSSVYSLDYSWGITPFNDGGGIPMIRLHSVWQDCYWSIEENNSVISQLQLFPNPATNQTSIQFDITQPSSAQISIINMQGKVIFEKTLNNLNAGSHKETIDTEKIAPGIYNVFIQVDERVSSGQLLIEH